MAQATNTNTVTRDEWNALWQRVNDRRSEIEELHARVEKLEGDSRRHDNEIDRLSGRIGKIEKALK
jgi:uncharacterized coiled-coil DUF342 family protein